MRQGRRGLIWMFGGLPSACASWARALAGILGHRLSDPAWKVGHAIMFDSATW